MTSPRVEKQRQIAYTAPAAANKAAASKTTAPLFIRQSSDNDNLIGLQVERGVNRGVNKRVNSNINATQEVYLQSGRKIVIQKLSDGRSVRKYYSADGKLLKPDYFKKVEGEVKVSADGKTYTATKAGATKTYKTKTAGEAKIAQEQAKLNKTKKEQGFIGKTWDAIKNNVLTFCDSSDKAQNQINAEKKLLQQILKGKVSKKDFKEVTGLDCTQANIQKFKNGKLNLKSSEKVSAYREGQKMAVDVVGDVAAGIGAGIAIATAPLTGGASYLLAAAVGAGTKAGLKYLDAKSGGREYNTFAKDCVTGGIAGLLTPVTMGAGKAVGNVTTKFVSKFAGAKVTSVATFVAKEGVVGGIYGGGMEGGTEAARQLRNGINGEGVDVGKVLTTTAEGFGGGALAGVLMSGGIKGVGKLGKSAGQKLHIIKKNEVLENELKELELFKKRTVELIDNQPYFHKIYKYQSWQTSFDKFVGIKERIDRYNLIKLFENKEFCKLYKSIVEDSNGRNIENKLKEKITSAFCSCMQRLDSKLNLELVETIMKDKSISNKEILKILDSINKSNQKLANILYKEGQENFENKCSILIHADSDEKAKLAEKLFLNKDLKIKQENIWKILYHSYNIEFTDKLCSDITIPRESIINILEKYVPSLTDKLCFDKNLNFPKNLIVDVLENINHDTNLSTAELLCTRNNFNFPTKLIPEALESCRWNYEAGKSKIIERLCSGVGLKSQTLKNEEYYDFALSFIKTFDESKASQILDRYIKYVNEMPNDKFLAVVKSVVNEELSLEETACMNALKTILGDNSTSAVLTARLLSEKKLYSLLLDNRIFNFNTVEFTKFVESVSFEEIAKFAPIVKNYTPMEKLEFLKLHFLLGTKEITPSRLSEPYLTSYLQKNPIYRDTMAEILNALPLTNRHIGKLPTEWFVNVPSNKSISKVEILVQKYIDNLVKEINHYKYDNSNIAKQAKFQSIQKFKMVMSRLLNTTVEIKELGVGLYGAGYKITIGNSTPIVLKVFERTRPRANNYHKSTFAWSQKYIDYSRGEHGMKSETQLGLFTNNNSENFVKMYFGKVCGEHNNDGYLITEFMSRGQGGDCCPGKYGYSSNPMYTIEHHDLNEENIIGGKIIDFGGIEIIQN